METQNILLQYTISDISKFILEYAFKLEKIRRTKDYFELGYYEKCIEIMKDIDSLNINKNYKSILISKLFKYGCDGGNIKIVELTIEKGANGWNNGLYRACKSGNIEIVELMTDKGSYDWDRGLDGACYGGNMKMVELMIEKGADDWNLGLFGACKGGNMKMVELMIEKVLIIGY